MPSSAQAGYAVVFLSRRGSVQPFVSEFQETLGAQTLTDFFQVGGWVERLPCPYC